VDIDLHVQSYFFAVRQKMFRLASFYQFLNSVEKKEHEFQVITDYEIRFTPHFAELGHKWGVWVPYEEIFPRMNFIYSNWSATKNVTAYPLMMLQEYAYPLIKRRSFFEEDPVWNVKKVDVLAYLKKNFTEVYERDIKPDMLQSKYRELVE
jgi:lipopolysaccharide biosynthesis protein